MGGLPGPISSRRAPVPWGHVCPGLGRGAGPCQGPKQGPSFGLQGRPPALLRVGGPRPGGGESLAWDARQRVLEPEGPPGCRPACGVPWVLELRQTSLRWESPGPRRRRACPGHSTLRPPWRRVVWPGWKAGSLASRARGSSLPRMRPFEDEEDGHGAGGRPLARAALKLALCSTETGLNGAGTDCG